MKQQDVEATEITATDPPLDTQPLATRMAQLVDERKASDIQVLRVRELVSYADWFVICSAASDRQVDAIADHVRSTLKEERDRAPLSAEGTKSSQWVVVDYGEVVLHIFFEPVRTFYQLEELWAEAPRLDWQADPADAPGPENAAG